MHPEDFWLRVGDRVSHIKDSTWIGTVTEIDDNLIPSGVTTCRVEWEGDYESDIRWTNKLVKLEG
jgi:hypothetical protein